MTSIFILTSITYIFFCIVPPYLLSEVPRSSNESQSDNKSIIVISDTQNPIWIEELFLSSNNNEFARNILFNSIIESQPDAVLHLGDLVSFGYDEDSWVPIDRFINKLYSLQIPFYPTLGNHELMIYSDEGEENFTARFPFYSKTGYLRKFGPIAFILLNSNFSDLTDEEINRQQNWYKDQLNSIENDSSIKAIIVGCHHPPYTNSRIVSSDEDVENNFVPEFLQSNKTKLFLSGHSHSFEHFSKSGKDFLTIGGGGGLHHPLYHGDEVFHEDLYIGDMKNRSFHYLQCNYDSQGMNIQIKMLKSDFSEIKTVYEIPLQFIDIFLVEKI